MTRLFTDRAAALDIEQVRAFDTVILKLSQNVETFARAALARSLAGITQGPEHVLHDLALDPDSSVAAPVLARGQPIADATLVRVAHLCGQDHLYALSRRRRLSERVTDVLVTRGDGEVVRSVAGNTGARFSEAGFTALTAHARLDAALAEILEIRRDIPPDHMAQLLAIAKSRAAERLIGEFAPDAVDAALTTATRDLAGPEARRARTDGAVVSRKAVAAQETSEQQIVAWVDAGKVSDALVALARAAAVPPEMVFRAYEAQAYDPLLFLIRSVRFGWGTLKHFIQSKPGKPPLPEEMNGAFEAFQALSVTTAQRVVRFTATRDHAQSTDVA
ncbi:DUF2336 domain-containing protein [Methylobacterium planeticum]|nr:DUF2336 domain-containing protein [Methylobacterium planeticum]